VRARLLWKLGLTYLGLILGVLLAVDFYSARVLRSDAIRTANDRLSSLLSLAKTQMPATSDVEQLRAWVDSVARSGARVTLIDQSGVVLADSAGEPAALDNHADRPEIQEAFAQGSGQSVRMSVSQHRELVYRAVRCDRAPAEPLVLRMALNLDQVDLSVKELRQRLLASWLVVLLLGGIVSFMFSQSFAARVERLKSFAKRLAEGDFRPMQLERAQDELSDLTQALNDTALQMDQSIASLSGERNRSSAILRSMVEGVAVIDAQERLVFCNRAFSEILNLDSVGTEGRAVIEVVRNSDLVGLIRRALKGEEGLQSDIVTGIVQPRSFSVTAAPVKPMEAAAANATAEKPSGAVVVLHDVTELRRLERVRQDFVANVSHEFKTPLTAIQGFAETLLAGAIDDPNANRRFLEIIREHATRLARLTDDLLKLARIEAGKLEVQFLPVTLEDVVESCQETALLKAGRKQISLETDLPRGLPAVMGDAGLLHDVLQNLLDNAVQYTPAGGRIVVGATAKGREAVVTVSDTGIGIPLADQERIFERFYRVDDARSREAGGTGLGLSIAKHIVEAHGGRLWVDSAVGRGSQFSFSVPLAP
jgi:two-component system, OmpR family, phosphate regulon sensor histidine kinase PhoR